MCLLNGEISGSIHANSTRFDIIEEEDGTEKKLLIKDIIKEMVHEHACEPLHNIIINDLEDYGLELLEYRGSSPLYLTFSTRENSLPNNILFNVVKLIKQYIEKIVTKAKQDIMQYLNYAMLLNVILVLTMLIRLLI